MRILRYLTRDILLHAAAVSFVLFLVVFAGRFIRYLAEAAVGSLTGDVLLPIMLFKLPGFFEMILPLGLFIGILLSLGRLYAESEMVVLRACGVGPGKLALYVMIPAAVVMVVVATLSLIVAPEGSPDPSLVEREQRRVHGLAWAATTLAALEALADWAARARRAGRFGAIEELTLRIGFGEYLHQLTSALPMGQGEFVRPVDLDAGTANNEPPRIQKAATSVKLPENPL